MNLIPWARAAHRPLRTAVLACAGLMSGAALLLAGCSQGGPASSASHTSVSGGSVSSAGGVSAPAAAQAPAGGAVSPAGSGPASPAQLDLSAASIVYTASLTVQARDVARAAQLASDDAQNKGGYVSSEQATIHPAGHARPSARLQLKIPVGSYPLVLGQLSRLGTQVSLSEQAQDVTQQVADVSSRVASAQAGIAQLRALLARAGSISDLLSVQQEINSQESSLEQLEASQRALSSETSYATVSLTLVSVSPVTAPSHGTPGQRHGFLGGLAAGWRGLRIAVSAVLTAVGAALPFAAVAAVLAAGGYAVRRRLLRRRSRPSAAGQRAG
jgi:hypothetical protein